MMRNRKTPIFGALLMLFVLGAVTALAGCGGDEQQAVVPEPQAATTGEPAVAEPVRVTTTEPLVVDALGTFDSKDPFVVQQTAGSGGTAGANSGGSGTSGGADGGGDGGSTTTDSTTPSDVSTSLHYLTVLSIDVANGVPTVTFEVDDVIYQDRKEGEVVETGWGQIKVLEIDAEDQVVVFLHGSETRSLKVDETYLK